MASDTSATWPPASGLTTPFVPREESLMTLAASTRIYAHASVVFDTVLDVSNYGKWNSFCPKVTIAQQPDSLAGSQKLELGTSFVFHVIMDSNKPQSQNATQLKVSDISTPSSDSAYIPQETVEKDGSYTSDPSKVYRIGWRSDGGLISKGLRAERFHEVIVLGDNECEVRTWENQAGVLVHIVKWMYQKTLEGKFKMWCNDLKKFCEEKVKAGGNLEG
ncbi:uncharacterized protein LTR77_003393 [Saxophila tyrrhenica]|uniref:Coenzyme Q-binding protein COQ10 START domain-containing protein n=1 Tax=Saxophila tyrrhenica TaxID=1690608 RepID=A0AAV9PEN4_9PEZI|nr:hypothetical protein LTR77_003393 [Saxophila tyrrhenica]